MSQQGAAHSTDVRAFGSAATTHLQRAASTSSDPGADRGLNHARTKEALAVRDVRSHAGGAVHRDWADLDSDDDLDSVPSSDLSAPGPACDGAAPDKAPVQPSGPPSLTQTLTQSLLIQSFSGNSQANSSVNTERLSPAQSDSPSAVVWQPSSTTVGFNPLTTVPEAGVSAEAASLPQRATSPSVRVIVPVATPQGHVHGYAGLLGAFGRDEQGSSDAHSPVLQPVSDAQSDPAMHGMLTEVSRGLEAGSAPEAAPEGMGGTYFMRGAGGACAAIFKPCDEEPLAPNNPKQWQGRAMGAPGMKPSVRVGEAALREVAAYLLDHGGFAGVPPACLAKCYHPAFNYRVQVPPVVSLVSIAAMPAAAAKPGSFASALSDATAADCSAAGSSARASGDGGIASAPSHTANGLVGAAGGLSRAFSRKAPLPSHSTDPAIAPVAPAAPGVRKLGSLQRFVPSKCDANDMSPSYFAADNVHRVGLLDLRLFNCDRHTGNLLVQEPPRHSAAAHSFPRGAPYTIVPIDHGYALPEALDNPYFEWLYWPQTSVPFSKEARAYVAALDAAADVAALRAKLPQLREECLRCLQTTTTVLKMCVAAGLTLFEIGSIFTRPEGANLDTQVPSDLEALCMDAREEAFATADSDDLGSSGTTSPSHHSSQPGSPISFNLNVHSANTLPAVEEIDSDADSGCFFDISAAGEELRSPISGAAVAAHQDDSASAAELSPLMFAMTPRDGVSISGVGASGSLFGSARRSSNSAVAADMSPLPGVLGDHTRFASMPFATHSFARRNVTSHDSDTAPTPAGAQSASGVAVSQGPATWGRRGLPRARRNAWRSKHGAQRNMGAYPALLPGTHPDQVNHVFSDLSEAQWRVFMRKLQEYVETELASCTWKAQRVTGCMAGSCPIAFDRRLR